MVRSYEIRLTEMLMLMTYCIVLHCIVLYCIVLCCVALRCVVLCCKYFSKYLRWCLHNAGMIFILVRMETIVLE